MRVFEARSICSSWIQPLLRKRLYRGFLRLRPFLFVAVGFSRCLGRHSIEFVFLRCLRPVLFVTVGLSRCLGRHSIEVFYFVFEASSICSSRIQPLLRKSLYSFFLCV